MFSLSEITRIDRYFYLAATAVFLLISQLFSSALRWNPPYLQVDYFMLLIAIILGILGMVSFIYYFSFTSNNLHDTDYSV